MLFDVRAPGRKRLIQAIYLVLAIVLVGGTILFGVGTGLPGIFGGNNDSGGIDLAKQQQEQLEKVEKQVAARPKDQKLLAQLASLHYAAGVSQIGDDVNSTTLPPKARAELLKAANAWQRYLDTDPNPIDPGLANKMVAVFSPDALKQPDNWANAQAIVTEAAVADAKARGQKPAVNAYLQLLTAQAAAGRKRQAKITADAARSVVPAAQRKELEAAIKTAQDPKAAEKAAQAGGSGEAKRTVTVPES
jgi:hypothetical protein